MNQNELIQYSRKLYPYVNNDPDITIGDIHRQREAWVSGYTTALTSPASGWVKCSERLPTRKAEYFVFVDDYKSVAIFDGQYFFGNDDRLNVTKWLDDSPLPTVEECMEYAKGLEDQPAPKKIYILLPVNLMKTIQYAQKPK